MIIVEKKISLLLYHTSTIYECTRFQGLISYSISLPSSVHCFLLHLANYCCSRGVYFCFYEKRSLQARANWRDTRSFSCNNPRMTFLQYGLHVCVCVYMYNIVRLFILSVGSCLIALTTLLCVLLRKLFFFFFFFMFYLHHQKKKKALLSVFVI